MALDQLQREGNPPAGQLPSPVPQYQIAGTSPAEFENAEGSDGASHHKLANSSGSLINPATEAKQDTLIAKDFATQTTLLALFNLINSAMVDV